MKLAIGVPIPQYINSSFLQNIIGIITHTMSLPGIDEVHYIDKGGVRTDKNRNVILKNAIDLGVDAILWLDADMLYPHDIVEKYLEHEFDVMGCLYFKRSAPYDAVGYLKGTNPIKPFRTLRPDMLEKDTVMVVDGLGFGGMMVKMSVYDALGDDKWMNYDKNFHLPFETENQLTHDLVFCRKVQEYGYEVKLHTGIKPGHIADYVVTEDDWYRSHEKKGSASVTVIMPTIHPELAVKTAKILSSRAGYPHKMVVIEDLNKQGFVAMCHQAVKDNPADYYVYLTDDIFPSRNWLLDGLRVMQDTGGKLFGFNDGKWNGAIATCGIVEANWMRKNYNGNMFYSGYFGHYNDTELTMLAMNERVYCYDAGVSLIEVDYEKEQKKVHKKDRELFEQRKLTGMDGKITDQVLLANFA